MRALALLLLALAAPAFGFWMPDDQAVWFNTNPKEPQNWRNQGVNRELIVDVSAIAPPDAKWVWLTGKLIVTGSATRPDKCQLLMWVRKLGEPWSSDQGHALQWLPGDGARENLAVPVPLVDGKFSAWFDAQIQAREAVAWSSAQAWQLQQHPTYCAFGADLRATKFE